MSGVSESLIEMIRPGVESLGYELVGVEYLGSRLRIYIDHADGINVDDCARVSHQVSGVLDVEDPIKENYTLEVSSPGLDRPLFYKADFDRFAGERASIKLREKLIDRRKFEGTLKGTEEKGVLLEVDGEELLLPFGQIEKAQLVPRF